MKCKSVVKIWVIVASIILNWYSDLWHQSEWEKEFRHCVAVYKEAIVNLEPNNIEQLPDYDRYIRNQQVANYMKSMELYLNFVEQWKSAYEEDKTEVYRLATLFMIMVYETDEYQWYSGGWTENRPHYEFVYCNQEDVEEILDTAIRMQAESYPIDEGTAKLLDESESGSPYSNLYATYEIYTYAATAWEREFNHCVAILYAQSREQLRQENVDDSEKKELKNKIRILHAYRDFTVRWAENNEEYARIDSGSGVHVDIAEGRMQAFRTGTLILVWIYEQGGGKYEFIYDYEEGRKQIAEKYWVE